MRLHENEEDFRDLCSITAGYIGIPEDAVRRTKGVCPHKCRVKFLKVF